MLMFCVEIVGIVVLPNIKIARDAINPCYVCSNVETNTSIILTKNSRISNTTKPE